MEKNDAEASSSKSTASSLTPQSSSSGDRELHEIVIHSDTTTMDSSCSPTVPSEQIQDPQHNSDSETNNENWSNKNKLFHAALKGDVAVAESIFNNDSNLVNAELLSERKETALHTAAGANRTEFVKMLISKNANVELRNSACNTAFWLAVAAGASDVVNQFLADEERRGSFTETPGAYGMSPLSLAASFGHEDIAKQLYHIAKENNFTLISIGERYGIFLSCIHNDLYELALEILVDNNFGTGLETARTPEPENQTALHILSQKPPSVFAIPENQVPWWKRFLRLSSQSCTPTESAALKLARELWKRVLKENQNNYSKIRNIIKDPFHLLMEASKMGNYDFLVVLISGYPELIWETYKGETIFHFAIKYRHVEVFKLIHEIGLPRQVLQNYEEEGKKENLLHVAARKPEQSRRRHIVGAALQMREEILWFEEVKKIAIPSFRTKMNIRGQTPEDLFTEEHRNLMKESEEWMKKNADVCLLVATIIVTVVFQAAFDVKSNKENETVHVILFISNAIAMSASSTAIMLFLAILISRFTKREMFWALPCRFICGIISLFISVTFMMVSFCLATFLASKSSAIRSCTCILQALPIPLFLYLVSPVLSDFIKTTFFSESAFKHRKPVLRYYDPRPEIRGPNNDPRGG